MTKFWKKLDEIKKENFKNFVRNKRNLEKMREIKKNLQYFERTHDKKQPNLKKFDGIKKIFLPIFFYVDQILRTFWWYIEKDLEFRK